MGSFTGRRLVVGVVLIVAIAGASVGAVLFSGGGATDRSVVSAAGERTGVSDRSSTTSTSTTTTSTTTTTTAPPPPPAPEPAPAAGSQGGSGGGGGGGGVAPVYEAPAPPPPPEPVSFCSGGAGGLAGAVLAAMNADRGGGLCWNSQLGGSAQAWAANLAASQSLYHSDIGSLLNWTSFSTVGENILAGPSGMSAGAMESAWMGSPSHRANILGGFSAAGVGIAQGGDGQVYVVVQFGG